MSLGLKYQGGFYSNIHEVGYDIQIYVEAYTGAVTSIGIAEDNAEIEWQEVDKLDPLMSSSATISLYSDTDRQFADLYTEQVDAIRIDILRNGTLYWSGMLDPELHEEPYAYLSGYAVNVTASDFAILDRKKWSGTGFMTLRAILTTLIAATGINYTSLEEHISTKISEYNTENILDALSVNCANFFDEDGESMTMREVLEAVLQPFGLQIIQKAGKVIIYDLNSIYSDFERQTVQWESDDSTLGVDKVYNNVKVKFSPYDKTELIGDELTMSGDYYKQLTTKVYTESTSLETGFYTDLYNDVEGMTIHANAKGFKIEPVYSGSEDKGIAWTVETFWTTNTGQNEFTSFLNEPTSTIGSMLMKLDKTPYLNYIGLNKRDYLLKLSMSMLFDVRYNPYEEAQKENEAGNWDRLKNWCNFVYVPFRLILRDSSGAALLHWENKAVKASTSYARSCSWQSGEGAWGDAFLCWYEGNRKNETGVGGWQTNKQIIGYYRGEKLPLLFDKMDNGEYIDLPSQADYLELQIGTGVQCYDYDTDSSWKLREDINEKVRWVMYKCPELNLVTKYGKSIDKEDVEHSAWINANAKEEKTFDTTVGTMKTASQTALAQLSYNGNYVTSLYRNGISDLLERLLIGTLYSNYAARNTSLSGVADLIPTFGIFTDTNAPGYYLLLSETQTLRDDESNIKMVTFSQDNYQAVEFES